MADSKQKNNKTTTIKKTQSNKNDSKKKPKTAAKRKKKPVKRRLTEKQKKFIHEYLKTSNATQSAINAGYSKKTAHAIGHENLRKLENEIQKEVANKESKKIAQVDEVLKFFTSVMRGDVEEEQIVLEGEGPGYTRAKKMTKQAAAKERIRAAENLAKRYGLFTDRVEISGSKDSDGAISNLINSLSDRPIFPTDNED